MGTNPTLSAKHTFTVAANCPLDERNPRAEPYRPMSTTWGDRHRPRLPSRLRPVSWRRCLATEWSREPRRLDSLNQAPSSNWGSNRSKLKTTSDCGRTRPGRPIPSPGAPILSHERDRRKCNSDLRGWHAGERIFSSPNVLLPDVERRSLRGS